MNKQLFLSLALILNSGYAIGMEHLQVSSVNFTEPVATNQTATQLWVQQALQTTKAYTITDDTKADDKEIRAEAVELLNQLHQDAEESAAALKAIDAQPLHAQEGPIATKKLDWLDPEDDSALCAVTAS